MLFFGPLVRHWEGRRRLRAELAADRAAVRRVGPPALAGALLGMVATAPPGTIAFGPAAGQVIAERIVALTGGDAPADPAPIGAGAVTVVGLLAAAVLVVCVGPLTHVLGLH